MSMQAPPAEAPPAPGGAATAAEEAAPRARRPEAPLGARQAQQDAHLIQMYDFNLCSQSHPLVRTRKSEQRLASTVCS